MALKTITFTVGVDEITPATIQDGGIQGDHKKTELRFNFNDELYNHLQGIASNGKLVYRFDATDGEGTVHHSDTAVLTGKSVVYPLEYTVTCHGGLVKVELIITLVSGEVSDEVLHTKPAELKLTFSPYSTGDKSQAHKDLSTLAEIVKDYALRAEKAERAAAEAQAQTALLSAAFKNGTTYIFNGGDASSEIDANFIVDGEVSDYSTNAVQNKVIKAYVDSKYPAGSVWVGGKNGDGPINPSTIFGGEWELIDKEFIPAYKSISIDETNNDDNGYFRYTTSTMGSAGLKFRRAGHSIDFTFKVTPNKNITESAYAQADYPLAIPVGQLNLTALGIWNLAERENTTKIYFTGFSDAGRAVAMMQIDLYNGKIFIDDILSGTNTEDNATIKSGEDIVFSFGLNVLKENIDDSNCGKFYWQKKGE